ncbi:MAG: asparagine synthase (glutamine-hydrolyzing) [Rhodocyclaceae bacterium]|nr:asparagine synthase (glutamine-hydrolyzing) [Rhodocyclaceae bacterium]MBX3667641.1 asparagine synthase (glutamine-hydrolyzing) [Rhodocyclaceae bacterium]
MCGIYGIIHLDGRAADPALMPVMGDVTIHRGPDDQGWRHDGPCVIGMRRLSIIDLSGGHQPIANEDETIWLVCNGEIYNFRELRRELEALGHRFRTHSDSEILIHAYEAWGDDFLLRLNGMFGFALWDGRRRRLLVGRDRLGIKPIYWRRDGQRVAFATEAKALLALPGVSAEVDTVALESYLHLGYVAAPRSIFKGVQKLPIASVAVFEHGDMQVRRYWTMPAQTDRQATEADWVERVKTGIEKSVAMQMVSDVPIGAFLSGGLDSSAVVACMAKVTDLPVKTYSIGFEGSAADQFYNELPYARRVAELFGTEHHEIVVRPDVVGLLPKLLWHMDEPIADTAFITTFLVSEFARRDVTVILSGVGGDELFGGYRRYLGNHYVERFERLPGWVQKSAIAVGRRLPADRHSNLLNVMRLAKGFLASAELSFEERYRAYLQVMDRAQVGRLTRVASHTPFDPLHDAFAASLQDDAQSRMASVDVLTQLPDDLLMLTDKMSMAVSLECRVPLLDHELLEMAAAMPESIKMRGGVLKHVMKQALAAWLPDDILHRKKRGFGTPMGAWLKGELAKLLDNVLSPQALERRGLFDSAAVQEMIGAHRANKHDYTDALLALLNFEIWARLFLDRRDPADLTLELKQAMA